MDHSSEIDTIIARHPFRKAVYDLIPVKSHKILDFGCNQGELLLRLKRDKQCRDLYGVEINEECRATLETHLDGSWIMDISAESSVLGDGFRGYFNFLILHDVVEHLYDPWYVLAKLHPYLAPEGKLILVTPNFQYWGFIQSLLKGDFFYGSGGGLMNEDHIRWFTYASLIELVSLSGFEAEQFQLLFPPDTDLNRLNAKALRSVLSLPPNEVQGQGPSAYIVNLPAKISKEYAFFLANKLLLICRPRPSAVEPVRLSVGGLSERRRHDPRQFTYSWRNEGGEDR